MVECLVCNEKAAGSIPASSMHSFFFFSPQSISISIPREEEEEEEEELLIGVVCEERNVKSSDMRAHFG
jgi:hypothetical protein